MYLILTLAKTMNFNQPLNSYIRYSTITHFKQFNEMIYNSFCSNGWTWRAELFYLFIYFKIDGLTEHGVMWQHCKILDHFRRCGVLGMGEGKQPTNTRRASVDDKDGSRKYFCYMKLWPIWRENRDKNDLKINMLFRTEILNSPLHLPLKFSVIVAW